ncbi:MAG: hypothetical protein JWP59_3150 [Massilia sp.]|nr:hypothetical protein [Massilia sp.]
MNVVITPAAAKPRLCAGFSYISVLLAIALLALCAAPAADAVRHAANAPAVSAGHLNNLLCLKSRIETVSAEPYQNLVLAAAGATTPTNVYSLAAAAPCPALNVYISMASVDAAGTVTYPAADTGLLQLVVTVSDESPSVPPGPPALPVGAAPSIASQPGSLASMSLTTMLVR